MRNHALVQIGTLAPTVLVLVALTDVVLRFMPIDLVAFRAWEAMEFNRRDDSPFCPSKVYHATGCYGDLSNMANLPAYRQYHSETFTTDRYGFRNPPSLTDGPAPDALLIGTSYSVGGGVNDDQTLSAQLGKAAHCRIYNGAGSFLVRSPEMIGGLAQRLHMTRGLVIHEFLEGHFMYPEFQVFMQARSPTMVAKSVPPKKPVLARFLLWAGGTNLVAAWHPLTVSRLQVLCQQQHRRLENDKFLPNSKKTNVSVLRLRSGSEMLFEPHETRLDQQPRDVSWAVPYWSWLAHELSNNNLALLVVLIPQKYTVYKPLLDTPGPPSVDRPEYLERIETALRRAGIPVINLTPHLRAAAEAELKHGRYVYALDDTHWNAAGIAVSARVIADLCFRSSPPDSPPRQ